MIRLSRMDLWAEMKENFACENGRREPCRHPHVLKKREGGQQCCPPPTYAGIRQG